MSRLVDRTERCSHLTNKETENFFPSEDEIDDGFRFEYVSASQFERLVKDVQRQRTKIREERKWDSFAERQKLLGGSNSLPNDFSRERAIGVKEFEREDVDDDDGELKRLEEDAMPEIDKICPSNRRAGEQNGRSKTQSAKKVATTEGTTVARRPNILLAVPEEQHSRLVYGKSSETKAKLVDDTRKSSSDRAVRRKHRLRELARALDESERDSGPKPSPTGVDDDEEEEFFSRPDPTIVRKVLAIQKKVSSMLDEISSRLENIPLPDGDRDLSRRVQRVAEFSVRFSRYYLYDLGRRIADMRRHALAVCSNARQEPPGGNSTFHLRAISQKMIVAHQILLQALSAYCNHIPSSTTKGHRRRLEEILRVVTDLKDICDKINISTEYRGSGDAETQPLTMEIHGKCRSILSKLELRSLPSDNGGQLTNRTTQSTTAATPTTRRSARRHKRKRLFSSLNMYNGGGVISKSDLAQRPSTSSRKPKKHAETSSKFLHYNRSTPTKQPNSSPATIASLSNGIARNHPDRVGPPQREDDIKTMVEISTSTDSELGSSVEAGPTTGYFGEDSSATKSEAPRQFFTSHRTAGRESRKFENDKKVVDDRESSEKVAAFTRERLSSLVPIIADLMSVITSEKDFRIRPVSSSSMETLLEFLQKYQSSRGETARSSSPEPDRLKGTRAGLKNMQLICLPYEENKDEESNRGDFSCKTNLEVVDPVPDTLPEDVTSGTAVRNGVVKSAIWLVAPVATDFTIPKYHRQYQHLIRANPMYLSSTNNKPWDVVAWIADKIVGDLIGEISKELEMDNIIEKMFDMEFEEY